MTKLPKHLQDLRDAMDVAEAAPATSIVDPNTGKVVTSLQIKLNAEETVRVMSAAPEQRAVMAQVILAQRAAVKAQRGVEKLKIRLKRAKRKQGRVNRRGGR